jgi:hypothetical protein
VNFGTMTKPFHAGHAARAGALAALLAGDGFTADASVLDGPLGVLAVFGGERDPDRPVALEALGAPWEVETPGINLKKYPSCGGTHTAVDLMLELVAEGVSADLIEGIDCRLADAVRKVLVHARPRTGLEGRFSVAYCLAAAVLDREVTLRQFDDAMVRRPEVEALMSRIRVATHPGVKTDTKDLLSELTVTLTDGWRLSRQARRRGATRTGRSRPRRFATSTSGARASSWSRQQCGAPSSSSRRWSACRTWASSWRPSARARAHDRLGGLQGVCVARTAHVLPVQREEEKWHFYSASRRRVPAAVGGLAGFALPSGHVGRRASGGTGEGAGMEPKKTPPTFTFLRRREGCRAHDRS